MSLWINNLGGIGSGLPGLVGLIWKGGLNVGRASTGLGWAAIADRRLGALLW